jgi:hypothetical protein
MSYSFHTPSYFSLGDNYGKYQMNSNNYAHGIWSTKVYLIQAYGGPRNSHLQTCSSRVYQGNTGGDH